MVAPAAAGTPVRARAGPQFPGAAGRYAGRIMRWTRGASGWLVAAALSSCGTTTSQVTLGAADEYLPFEEGRTWQYEISDAKGRSFRLATVLQGGDVRTMAGEEGVRFVFVYGTPAGADHDVTKSIYALPRGGPCEYYFDAMLWSLWHDPPIPLLPTVVAIGEEVGWQGAFEYGDEELPARARVRIEGIESLAMPTGSLDTVRVRTDYEGHPVVVTRWFARGVGLVRIRMRVAGSTVGATLLSHTNPPPTAE